MFKQVRFKSILVISGIITVSLPAFSSALPQIIANSNEHLVVTLLKNNKKKSMTERIRDIFRRGGSDSPRSPEKFCSIWPVDKGPDYLTTWSDRPTFVWQGNVKEIRIYHFSRDEIVKSFVIEPNTNIFHYPDDSQPLERGKLYHYVTVYESNDGKEKLSKRIVFKVMNADHEKFTEVSQAIENSEITFTDPDEILRQADYFSSLEKPKLMADAIRVMFSFNNNDPQWDTSIESYVKEECQFSETP